MKATLISEDRSMKRIFKKKKVRYLLSAVIFGIIYSVLSLIDKGNMKIGSAVGAMALYLVFMCILCAIAPIIKKITGYDKKTND